ncbi:hypothetical protein [Methylobacterium sp. J-092]|uniref:hypothetical protein n=1 Tax=Methylobacterium sp. J-092 TaxID=2836667 RepID=UPI001FB93A90|nr:hypothetical protein [Methylobacterium sp. J-092]MCJ2009857.1 hypothetical protein [Methylobacterium sp. J-092]
MQMVAAIRLHALRITLNLMLHKKWLDWSAWTVEICDPSGRHVVSRPFADALTIQQPRQV